MSSSSSVTAPMPRSASRTSVIFLKNSGSSRVSVSRRSPSSTATTSVIRPGRGDITTTRSARNTASGIEWVTNTTLVPASALIRSSSDCMCSRVISSRAPNGSSINSSCGAAASALAIATRCCMPPDSCHGRWLANSSSLTSSSISIARCRRRARSQPFSSSGNSTLRTTVRQSNRPACWNAIP